jgi:uncharacterized membrane protein HdeD (DUF308 family)
MNEETKALKSVSNRGILWGILTIILGLVAMGSPLVAGLWTTLFFGIALLGAGVSMIVFAFQAPSLGNAILKILFGILTVVIGIAIISQPDIGLAKLTLFLGIYFIFDGFLAFILAWNVKPEPGWGWMTFNGAVTVMLGWLILNNWPASALWAVGVLVGVRLLFAGVTMLTLGTAGRQVARSSG